MKRLILLIGVVIFFVSGCASIMNQQIAENRRKEYVASHNPDPSTKQAILNGQIMRGMTKSEVKASWGTPHNVNRSVGSWGTKEQWVYSTYNLYLEYYEPHHYLYFENGKLTGWQEVN